MSKYALISFLMIFSFSHLKADDHFYMDMTQLEDSLNFYLKKLRASASDGEKDYYNELLKSWVKKAAVRKESFKYPFDSLKTMGTITSPDKAFRLFNWNIENDDETFSYYCFIMKNPDSNNKYPYLELIDNSANMRSNPTDMTFDHRNWYGALYYDIIPVIKGGKTIYTLLAWDGNNRKTTKKFIETMYFLGSKRVKFGYPIIKTPKGKMNRYFLEYSSDLFISLKNNSTKKEKLIIFDHLSPSAPQISGLPEFTGPDGSHDAFRFEDGYWVYVADIFAVNKDDKEDYHDPRNDEIPDR